MGDLKGRCIWLVTDERIWINDEQVRIALKPSSEVVSSSGGSSLIADKNKLNREVQSDGRWLGS